MGICGKPNGATQTDFNPILSDLRSFSIERHAECLRQHAVTPTPPTKQLIKQLKAIPLSAWEKECPCSEPLVCKVCAGWSKCTHKHIWYTQTHTDTRAQAALQSDLLGCSGNLAVLRRRFLLHYVRFQLPADTTRVPRQCSCRGRAQTQRSACMCAFNVTVQAPR